MRKVMLITGASSGIGAATAALAAPDHDLALHYNANADGMAQVARTCREAGARVTTHRADLGDPSQVAALFASFDADHERLDALVNNAGMVDRPAAVEDYDPGRVARIVAVNLTAPILVAGQAVRRMRDGGAIVNVSSAAAKHGAPGQSVDYAAAKAGLEVFAKGLALEVAGRGIRVATVRPGIVATPIHAKGGQPDRAERLAPTIPMGRPGEAAEVARAILWLLSPEASYVTDAVLDVSGGR